MEKNVLDILERPFEASQIKQRQGSFGKTLDYVEGHEVLRRLAEAFNGDFSFRVLEWKVLNDEVIVLAELEACGLVKQAIGSKKHIANSEWGDTAKAAITDAVKATSKMYGVALHLWGDKETPAAKEEKKEDPKSNGSNGGNGRNGAAASNNNQGATNAQLRAITNLCKRYNLGTKEQSALFMEVAQVRSMSELNRATSSLVIQKLQTLEGQKAA